MPIIYLSVTRESLFVNELHIKAKQTLGQQNTTVTMQIYGWTIFFMFSHYLILYDRIVFALPPDSAIHRAMEGNMYTTPRIS